MYSYQSAQVLNLSESMLSIETLLTWLLENDIAKVLVKVEPAKFGNMEAQGPYPGENYANFRLIMRSV